MRTRLSIGGKWLLALAAIAAGTTTRAQDAWKPPDHLRASNVRVYSSDGTPPAASKGPVAKPIAYKPKREAVILPAATPEPVSLPSVTPVVALQLPTATRFIPWPKMPHGYQDPTHPVGPAEPGSAEPLRTGPASAGWTLPRRR